MDSSTTLPVLPTPSSMHKSTANIVAFLFGQGIATLGAFIVMYSIIWHVTLETKSGSMLALLSVVQTLPTFFTSPVAGVIADRYNRRVVAIVADSFVALVTLFLAVFLNAVTENIAVLLLVVFVRSLGQGFQEPVMMAIVPQITPDKHLARVNGVMDTLMSVTMLASPAIAAGLMAFTTLGNICLVAVATSVVGIAIMLFCVKVPDINGTEIAPTGVSVNDRATPADNEGFFAKLFGGFRYIRGNPFLLRMSVLMFVLAFFFSPAANLGPLLIVRNWGDNTFFLSISEMAFSVGMIIGGVVISVWGGFKNRTVTFAIAVLIIGFQYFGFGMSINFGAWMFIVTFSLCGFIIPIYNTPAITSLMEHAQDEYMGRVMSVCTMTMGLGQPIAAIIFGPLADICDINLIMLGVGIPLILCAVYVLRNKVLLAGGASQEKVSG